MGFDSNQKTSKVLLKKYLQVNKVLETGMPDEYLKTKIQCILKNHQEDEKRSLSIFKIHINPSEQCLYCIVYPGCTDWVFSMLESCYLCLRWEEVTSHFSGNLTWKAIAGRHTRAVILRSLQSTQQLGFNKKQE